MESEPQTITISSEEFEEQTQAEIDIIAADEIGEDYWNNFWSSELK